MKNEQAPLSLPIVKITNIPYYDQLSIITPMQVVYPLHHNNHTTRWTHIVSYSYHSILILPRQCEINHLHC